MLPTLPESWRPLLNDVWLQPSLDPLREFLETEYASTRVYPLKQQIFTAFELTSPANVKVVILGQDPYHQPKQAHGLAFSVQPGIPPPASLRNIFKELKVDLGVTTPAGQGDLSAWARQGVLLLNATLTVREGLPLSHRGKGWETFTDAAIKAVSDGPRRVVFILWGAHAQKKFSLIDAEKHVVIQSAHPSPLSARNGFFGSKPFSKVNEALRAAGREEIDWSLAELEVE